MVQTYHEIFYTLNHSESEIKFLSIDKILGVILYPEVVLHMQILPFIIAQIFLRISNLQHVSPKL